MLLSKKLYSAERLLNLRTVAPLSRLSFINFAFVVYMYMTIYRIILELSPRAYKCPYKNWFLCLFLSSLPAISFIHYKILQFVFSLIDENATRTRIAVQRIGSAISKDVSAQQKKTLFWMRCLFRYATFKFLKNMWV